MHKHVGIHWQNGLKKNKMDKNRLMKKILTLAAVLFAFYSYAQQDLFHL